LNLRIKLGGLNTNINNNEAKQLNLLLPEVLNLIPRGEAFENIVGDDEKGPSKKPSYLKTGAIDGSSSSSTVKEDLSDDPIAQALNYRIKAGSIS